MFNIHKATMDVIFVVEFIPFCDTLVAVLSFCRLNRDNSAKRRLAIDQIF